jgi:hypothetical protein
MRGVQGQRIRLSDGKRNQTRKQRMD